MNEISWQATRSEKASSIHVITKHHRRLIKLLVIVRNIGFSHVHDLKHAGNVSTDSIIFKKSNHTVHSLQLRSWPVGPASCVANQARIEAHRFEVNMKKQRATATQHSWENDHEVSMVVNKLHTTMSRHQCQTTNMKRWMRLVNEQTVKNKHSHHWMLCDNSMVQRFQQCTSHT